jgi:hypothetical protein
MEPDDELLHFFYKVAPWKVNFSLFENQRKAKEAGKIENRRGFILGSG